MCPQLGIVQFRRIIVCLMCKRLLLDLLTKGTVMSDSDHKKPRASVESSGPDDDATTSQPRRGILKALWVSPIVLLTASPGTAQWAVGRGAGKLGIGPPQSTLPSSHPRAHTTTTYSQTAWRPHTTESTNRPTTTTTRSFRPSRTTTTTPTTRSFRPSTTTIAAPTTKNYRPWTTTIP